MKKIALITGGNSGIGYATARLLKEKEYEVFISGRDPDRISHAADELGVRSIIADMANSEDIKVLASYFMETGLDVLVNNAGVAKFFTINNLTAEAFSEVFNINVRGPLLLIRELLPALEKRHGSISTVTSIIVNKGRAAAFLYAASKGGVDAFTRSLAVELGPRNIRINAVAPGAIDTPIFTKIGINPEKIAELMNKFKSENPLSRLGSPDDVAKVIAAQLESTYVTGAVWVVDGGVSAA